MVSHLLYTKDGTSYCKLKEYEGYENTNKSIELFDKSYETLEFLGDSLLGSCVTRYLYNRYVNKHNKYSNSSNQLSRYIQDICHKELFLWKNKLSNKHTVINIEDIFDFSLKNIFYIND